MRALAVTSAQRWPTLPNVPTMAEVGCCIRRDLVALTSCRSTAPAIVETRDGAKEVAAEPSTQNRFSARRGASCFEHPDRGRGFRRQGDRHVARGRGPLRL